MIIGIGIAGAIGACVRYYISTLLWTKSIKSFPVATFFVNMTGSFLLGYLFTAHHEGVITDLIWQYTGVGFLGAFTTFSTFSYEWISLIREKKYRFAIIYILLSLVIGIGAAYLGYIL